MQPIKDRIHNILQMLQTKGYGIIAGRRVIAALLATAHLLSLGSLFKAAPPAEVVVSENMLSMCANKDRLPKRLQAVYDTFYARILNYENFMVDFQNEEFGYDDFYIVMRALREDHPELWLYLDSDESIYDDLYNGNHRFIKVFYGYLWINNRIVDTLPFSPKLMDAYINRIDHVCDQIVRKMPDGLTNLQKYRYLAKALCDMTIYVDKDYNDMKDPLQLSTWAYCHANGPLLKGEGLCQAYAEAYQWLCHRAGLACVCVESDSSVMAHAWNLVQLENDDTYHVDVTWSDGGLFDDWFMMTQEEVELDHYPVEGGFAATGKPLQSKE